MSDWKDNKNITNTIDKLYDSCDDESVEFTELENLFSKLIEQMMMNKIDKGECLGCLYDSPGQKSHIIGPNGCLYVE
jgi:hypothetical protein